ncbi:DUF2171 domain-containing protein [Flaviflagellibacter deserti]|uniref:DUF2171 domain-containing protein n=1 Tax=Flaviflagellibacter deserti TaxID=2267266 RepID=A0ABV9Z1Y2_9HYPH
MAPVLHIKENMDVVGADGVHIGTVDFVENDETIVLSRLDDEEEKHHAIPLEWVERVNAQVHLDRSSDEARAEWEERD